MLSLNSTLWAPPSLSQGWPHDLLIQIKPRGRDVVSSGSRLQEALQFLLACWSWVLCESLSWLPSGCKFLVAGSPGVGRPCGEGEGHLGASQLQSSWWRCQTLSEAILDFPVLVEPGDDRKGEINRVLEPCVNCRLWNNHGGCCPKPLSVCYT